MTMINNTIYDHGKYPQTNSKKIRPRKVSYCALDKYLQCVKKNFLDSERTTSRQEVKGEKRRVDFSKVKSVPLVDRRVWYNEFLESHLDAGHGAARFRFLREREPRLSWESTGRTKIFRYASDCNLYRSHNFRCRRNRHFPARAGHRYFVTRDAGRRDSVCFNALETFMGKRDVMWKTNTFL